jgi:hypothetical protein
MRPSEGDAVERGSSIPHCQSHILAAGAPVRKHTCWTHWVTHPPGGASEHREREGRDGVGGGGR